MCYPVMRRDYLDLTKPKQAAVQSLKTQNRMRYNVFYSVFLITLRSFAVWRGGTHSILAKRRNPEYSEKCFFLSLQGNFALLNIIVKDVVLLYPKVSADRIVHLSMSADRL